MPASSGCRAAENCDLLGCSLHSHDGPVFGVRPAWMRPGITKFIRMTLEAAAMAVLGGLLTVLLTRARYSQGTTTVDNRMSSWHKVRGFCRS